MGELLQMRLQCYIVCAILALANASGQGHCSLEVKVETPDGRELTDIDVVVEENDGRLLTKEGAIGGVQFCDLGILPVTVRVGHESCNQVIVRNVPLSWGGTVTLKVVHDRDRCLVDVPPPPIPLCRILFRFVDENDSWVEGVRLRLEGPGDEVRVGDVYGRVLTYVEYGKSITGMASADGYLSKTVKAHCSKRNSSAEQYVVLRPAAQ